MPQPSDPLAPFHPLISRWFSEQVGTPTDVQQQGWPRIAAGEHVLITAPTGSGKTLTAFLWAINQLATRVWSGGCTRVIYVSPLKALNNDIRRNLLKPLAALRQIFTAADVDLPPIAVQTRSGDTPQGERRRMLHKPPEILITTPESLNLLLSSAGGRSLLGGITTVILDEIHAVVGNKRGVHLITAVDRLVRLTGEFQRIALSATVKPLDTVAAFVGGLVASGSPITPHYTPRPVAIVRSSAKKRYRVEVRFPEEGQSGPSQRATKESFWRPLTREFKGIIGRNRATLLFVNSRRLCEKLTLKINKGESQPVAYAHHGSLSREIRLEVESRLKAGDLKAIMATNSLELGIDIGDLDEVVLIQSPPAVSSAVQRVGRAGHRIGAVSRAVLYPTHPHDFLEAAVLAPAIIAGDIETVQSVQCPLDVLAQIMISMAGTEVWDRDDLYATIKTSYPYRHLNRDQFDLVLNMLAGRYAQSRIRELKPRLSLDGLDNTVAARPGALLALYTSGGVIPDRGYYHLRHNDTHARIGELDEEFVWEATIGQIFTLGTQNWKIQRITHNDVLVTPGNPKAMAAPFWRGEGRNRDFHFSERIATFLEDANQRLKDPAFVTDLEQQHFMGPTAAEQLIKFLKRQKEYTECDLPHRHHMLIEHIRSGPSGTPGNQVILHTFWGGRLNRPFALALSAAWEEKYRHRPEIYAANDGISLMLPREVEGRELLSMVAASRVPQLLKQRLEGSGVFGACFREAAGRALLLTRRKFNERVPLWMNRLRSQKLMDAVADYDDFPILLEAWRSCLQDSFDLHHLDQILGELETGTIAHTEIYTARPSPMAQDMAWRQINEYMYRGDAAAGAKATRLNDDLLQDLVFSADLRPAVTAEIVAAFERKRQRLAEGYSPAGGRDVLDWVKERRAIPQQEWQQLLAAIERDHGLDPETALTPVAAKLVRIHPRQAKEALIIAVEDLPLVTAILNDGTRPFQVQPILKGIEPAANLTIPSVSGRKDRVDEATSLAEFVGEWLQFYGPVPSTVIADNLGIAPPRLQLAVEDLIDSRTLISGRLLKEGPDNDLCDSQNFETLLRLMRIAATPVVEPLPLEQLPLMLAAYQGVAQPKDNDDGINDALYDTLEQLVCYRARAGLWESEILPARIAPYRGESLDRILQETDLRWSGHEKQGLSFCFDSDLDLLHPEPDTTETDADGDDSAGGPANDQWTGLFIDPAGRYDFAGLNRNYPGTPAQLYAHLWDGVWQNRIGNDSFLAVRRGIVTRFEAPQQAAATLTTTTPRIHRPRGRFNRRPRRPGRGAFNQRQVDQTLPGTWYLMSRPEITTDLLDREERNKARVRLLLDRYGILFRELLLRELPHLRWAPLFRALRIMELSGEVWGGCFFNGLPGLQFITPKALRLLQHQLSDKAVFWLNACDPACLCGTGLESFKGALPPRLERTHLVYHGPRLVMVSRAYGKQLLFNVPSDDPDLPRYFGPLHHLLTRDFEPKRCIAVTTINDRPAPQSPYLAQMRVAFEVVADYQKVTLYRSRPDV